MKDLQTVGEIAGVGAGAFMLCVAVKTGTNLNQRTRWVLGIIGAATIVIDVMLLKQRTKC